jgi:methylphosphotriester-DNA--protein-cysteine methyltransferase
MSDPNSTKGVRELIHDAVDSTTTTVQNIHQAIANAPFDALAEVDGLARLARDLHETQDRVVSAVYDTVRKVNREIQQVGDDLLG